MLNLSSWADGVLIDGLCNVIYGIGRAENERLFQPLLLDSFGVVFHPISLMVFEKVISRRKIWRTYFVDDLSCHLIFRKEITAPDGTLYRLSGMRTQVRRRQ